MLSRLNYLLDIISELIAHPKRLLPIPGTLLIPRHPPTQFIPWFGWFAESNLLLHVGIIVAIIGILFGWAL